MSEGIDTDDDADGGSSRSGAESPPDDEKAFAVLPAVGVFALFTVTILGGLALVGPFGAARLQAFEDPSSLANVALIIAEVLVATGIFLLAFRYGIGETAIRAFVVLTVALVVQYPAAVVLPTWVPYTGWVALAMSGSLATLLWVYPEWYVIDAGAVAFGAAAIGLFGISLSPLPVLVLLVLMAVYDAYSVYVSEHMQSLGGGIVDLKLPMVFVVPTTLSFSLLEVDDLEELSGSAHLLGLGDAMFPGLLAASGATFLGPEQGATPVVAGLNAPSLGALGGALAGMVALELVLFYYRRAHAGLPALNAGVIGGYLLGAVVAGVPVVEALGVTPYL